jgi:hypothetical protein
MGQNTLPSGINDLLLLAERIAQGLETYGPWLEITQIPADEFRRISDEAGKAETAWSAAMSAKRYSQTRMAAADEALDAWLEKARLVMLLARGAKWSQRWIETGFTHRGRNVPKDIERRIALARRVVIFLALHPTFGVPFADVTAACGRSIYERMVQARAARDVAVTDCMSKKRQRDAAESVLRRTMRQVILILGATIAPTDPRWLAFGLNQPTPRSSRTRHVHGPNFAEVLAEPILLSAKPLPAETQPDCQHIVAA